MKNIYLLILAVGLAFCSPRQNIVDDKVFDAVLNQYVDLDGKVDYKGIKADHRFSEYLEQLAEADISKFSGDAKLAFWINAYNASVVKNVLDHYPLDSPMSVDGFFKKFKFNVAGENLSLDEIEHQKVMKIEPVLIHFGLVCGASSCPKLIPHAYFPESVYKQLEQNAKDFMNDKTRNRLDREYRTLYLSSIFKWFKNYFVDRYGSLKKAAMAFINDNDSRFLAQNNVEVKYLNYNWELNTQ